MFPFVFVYRNKLKMSGKSLLFHGQDSMSRSDESAKGKKGGGERGGAGSSWRECIQSRWLQKVTGLGIKGGGKGGNGGDETLDEGARGEGRYRLSNLSYHLKSNTNFPKSHFFPLNLKSNTN